jgi:hypothetical protein
VDIRTLKEWFRRIGTVCTVGDLFFSQVRVHNFHGREYNLQLDPHHGRKMFRSTILGTLSADLNDTLILEYCILFITQVTSEVIHIWRLGNHILSPPLPPSLNIIIAIGQSHININATYFMGNRLAYLVTH